MNARITARDSPGTTGVNVDLTGSRHLHMSPGLRARLNNRLSGYGSVQVPLVQRVNGLQLTSKVNDLVGLQQRFSGE